LFQFAKNADQFFVHFDVAGAHPWIIITDCC
jgi:hypothetical protein